MGNSNAKIRRKKLARLIVDEYFTIETHLDNLPRGIVHGSHPHKGMMDAWTVISDGSIQIWFESALDAIDYSIDDSDIVQCTRICGKGYTSTIGMDREIVEKLKSV